MKNIRRYEEFDYLSMLKKQKSVEDQMNTSREIESEKIRGSNYLSKIKRDSEESIIIDNKVQNRRELTHIVVQSIIYSEQVKPGFEDFKSKLMDFLNSYPLDTLPKSH